MPLTKRKPKSLKDLLIALVNKLEDFLGAIDLDKEDYKKQLRWR